MSILQHTSPWHLALNLLLFAAVVPRLFRSLDIPRLLLVGLVAQMAGLGAQSISDAASGASGAVAGASVVAAGGLSAAAWMAPAGSALRIQVLILAGLVLVLTLLAPRSPIAHAAHLGGMLGGAFAVWAIQRVSPGRRGAPRCKVRQE